MQSEGKDFRMDLINSSTAVIEPAQRVSIRGGESIHSVSFSPDGNTVYAAVPGNAIDLCAVVMERWPEIGGVLTGLAVAVWLVMFLRVRGRPQTVGAPHCRRCNYNVVSQTEGGLASPQGAACPECGVDLQRARPLPGRTLRRRMWMPTACVGVIALGFIGLTVARLPRVLPKDVEFGVWSEWVDATAERHAIGWLQKHKVGVWRIERVDSRTGNVSTPLRTCRGYPATNIRVSPDGGHIVYGEQRGRIVWIEARTGWIDAAVDIAPSELDGHEEVIVGFDGEKSDPRVYFAAVSQEDRSSRLMRWRPRTGEVVMVSEEPAYQMTYNNGSTAYLARKYSVLHWKEGTATASAPGFSEAYHLKKFGVVVRGPGENQPVARTITADGIISLEPMVTTPDGGAIFLPPGSFALRGFDTRTGESLGQLSPSDDSGGSGDWRGSRYTYDGRFCMSADGARLFASAFPQSILVRDVKRRAWIARLKVPEPYIAPKPVASPDGRWLAAITFKSTSNTPPFGTFLHELQVFDLSALKPGPEPDWIAP